MLPTEPIRPIKDVWLRPRRVFRELATQPIKASDYLLAAAQGVVNCLALYRTQGAGAHSSVEAILGNSFLFGPIAGVVSLFFFSAIYSRLGARAGGQSSRAPVVHVLAYGGVPLVAALLLWVLTALVAGEGTFIVPSSVAAQGAPGAGADTELFVVVLLRAQFIAYVVLLLWSIVLQVMGFSEIFGLATRKAFWVYVLGQIVGLLAAFFIAILSAILFPGIVPSAPS